MSNDEHIARLIDVDAGVSVGQGYRLAWSVGPDGDTWPILADEDAVGPEIVPHHPRHFREMAPHEQVGRLPEEFAQFRCGARASSSRRACKVVVSGPGVRCKHHPLEAEVVSEPPVRVPPSAPAPTEGRPRDGGQGALFDVDELRGSE